MCASSVNQSREAQLLVTDLAAIVENGVANRQIQITPHLILLSQEFYHEEIKPKLVQWLIFWIDSFPHSTVTNEEITAYLMTKEVVAQERRLDLLDDDFFKLLNLCCDWLHSFLPFILGKIDRVTFGILSEEDLQRALARDPRMPRSRKLTAVPFVGT